MSANPVDRGKPGSKLHLVSEGRGLPLTAAVTAANVNDILLFAALLEDVPAVLTPAGRRRSRPGKVDAGKAYDHAANRAWLRRRGITARIAGVGSSRRAGWDANAGGLSGRCRGWLSDTGCRLGEDAKALLRAARDKAARGRAAEAQADVAAQMDFGRLGGGLVRLLGKRMMKEPGDASDYIATLDADLSHDATEVLPRINAPTLVIAGTRDFFFPEPIVRETAERVPDATLRLYEGVGHPVGKIHKRRFERDVLGFLHG